MQPSDRQNEPASNQPIQTTGVVGIRPGVSVQESRQERQEPVVGMRGDIPNPLTNPVTAARIRRLASISDNPQAEIDRIEAAQYMANFTRFSPATILRNFDAVSREFIGQTYSPGSVLNQMRDAWRSTRLQQEAGELMSEAWFSRNPREYIERATAILDQAPPTPQNINVFQQVANATARTLPWFVNPIPEGIQGAAFGALIGAGLSAVARTAVSGLSGPLAPATSVAVAAMAKGARIGYRTGSSVSMGKVMMGLQFYEMLTAEDENGNTIDLNTARALSAGAGIINGLLEATQLDLLTGNPAIKGLYRRAATRTLRGAAISGVGRASAIGAMAQYGTRLGGEVLTELAQESVDWFTYNVAADMQNRAGANIATRDVADFVETMKATARESAMGFALLAAPGTISSYRQGRASARAGADTGRAIRTATGNRMLTDEEISGLTSPSQDIREATYNSILEQNPPTPDEVEIQETESGYRATLRGIDVATFDVQRDGNTVSFTGGEQQIVYTADPVQKQAVGVAARKVMKNVYESAPDAIIEFDVNNKDQAWIKRAIEDSIPELRKQNELIDRTELLSREVSDNVAAARQEIARQQEAELGEGESIEERTPEIERAQEDIEAYEAELTELQLMLRDTLEAKADMERFYFDLRENSAVTLDTFAEKIRHAEKFDRNRRINRPDGRAIAGAIRKAFNDEIVTDDEVELAVELLEMAANREGKSLEQYVSDTFVPGIFQDPDIVANNPKFKRNRASTRFMEDGRAIISAAKSADFTSFVHEVAHVFRRQLSDDDMRIAAEFAGQVDPFGQWTEDAEEAFVDGFFLWADERQEFSGPIAKVFARLKQFLARAVEIVRAHDNNLVLNDEMRDVYARLFGEEAPVEAIVEADRAADEMELYQPMHEGEVRAAVESYKFVPFSVLEEYRGQEWADREIARREADVARREEMSDLYDMAREMSYPDFEAYFMLDPDSEHDPATLRHIWDDANISDINEGNRVWANSLSMNDIYLISDLANQGIIPFSAVFVKAISGKMSARQEKAIRMHLMKNGTTIRYIFATDGQVMDEGFLRGSETDFDYEELYRLRAQQEKSEGVVEDESLMPPKEKLSSLEIGNRLEGLRHEWQWEQERRKNPTAKEIDKAAADAAKEIEKLDAEVKELNLRMQEIASDLSQAYGRTTKLKNTQTELEADISTSESFRSDMAARVSRQRYNLQKFITLLQRDLESPGNAIEIKQNIDEVIRSLDESNQLVREYRKYRKKQEQAQQRRDATKEAKKLRAEMKKMAQSMLRAARSPSVDYEVRKQIQALTGALDPSFKGKRARDEIKALRKEIKANPEMFGTLSPDLQKKVTDLSLSDFDSTRDPDAMFTFGDMQELYEAAIHLRQVGRLIYETRQNMIDSDFFSTLKALESQLVYRMPAGVADPTGERMDRPRNLRTILLSTYRPQRLADMLDGGAGFEGAHHKFFVDQVNAAENKRITETRNRRRWLIDTLNERTSLNLTEENVAATLAKRLSAVAGKIGATEYSLDAVLEIYAGFKNAKKMAAIVMGNGRDRIMDMERDGISRDEAIGIVLDEFRGLIDGLSDEDRVIADAIIDEYEANYSRVEEAAGYWDNIVLGHEEFYTPMFVGSARNEAHEKTLQAEMNIRAGFRRAGIDRRFTIDRLRSIRLEHRRPLRLGLFSNWEQAVMQQERYIAYAKWTKQTSRLLNSDAGMAWRERITRGSPSGAGMLDQITRYRDRVVSPQSFLPATPVNKLMAKVRSNAAIAYLSFNLVTAMKQIPSIGFYLVEAGPVDLFTSLAKAMTGGPKFFEEARQRNPQLRERNVERLFNLLDQEISKTKLGRTQQDIARIGTALIKAFDSFAVTVGEDAVYNKAIRDGKTEAEAAELASNVTLRTQPAGGMKDTADIFTQPVLYLFTQFSNQLNQIWNIYTYDIPKAYNRQGFRRQQLMSVASLALSSYLIWMLTNRQVSPDEPDEFVDLVASQFINAAPIVGPVLNQAMLGYGNEVTSFAPVRGVGVGLGAAREALAGESLSDYEKEKAMKEAFESLAVTLGIPYIAPERIYRAAKLSEDELEFISTAVTGGNWTMHGDTR